MYFNLSKVNSLSSAFQYLLGNQTFIQTANIYLQAPTLHHLLFLLPLPFLTPVCLLTKKPDTN